MQEIHDSKEDSKKFLKWCHIDKDETKEDLDLTQNVKEDAMGRKRRLQGEILVEDRPIRYLV